MIFLVGNNLRFPKLTNIKPPPSSLNHLRVSCQPAAPSPQTIQVCNSCKQGHSPSEPQHSWMVRKLALTHHDSVILRPLSSFAKCLNNALWAAGASSGSHVGAPSIQWPIPQLLGYKSLCFLVFGIELSPILKSLFPTTASSCIKSVFTPLTIVWPWFSPKIVGRLPEL